MFEVLPVIGGLLFRTGLTGYRSRIPFILSFALSFGTELVRQKVPIFERRICELHVKAVMEGELRHFNFCRHRLDADESPMSAPQLAATMVVALVLLLPYVQGLVNERLRSSLFSCWLGVACVLVLQLAAIFRMKDVADIEYNGTNQKLTPKHRRA